MLIPYPCHVETYAAEGKEYSAANQQNIVSDLHQQNLWNIVVLVDFC